MIKHEHILMVKGLHKEAFTTANKVLCSPWCYHYNISEILRPQRARDNKRGTEIILAVKKRTPVSRSCPKGAATNAFWKDILFLISYSWLEEIVARKNGLWKSAFTIYPHISPSPPKRELTFLHTAKTSACPESHHTEGVALNWLI